MLPEVATMPAGQELAAAEALFRLAEWTNCTGEAYFRGLVSGLSDVLAVRWVYLSKLHPFKPRHVQVVAGWVDGEPTANIEYDLSDTPCAEVLTGNSCFFQTGVAARFPLDLLLTDLGVESYAGTPLQAADGQVQGLLTIMHDRPIDASRHHPCCILSLVAGRAAAELERTRVEAQLRQREEEIRFLSESTPSLLWRATTDGRLDYLSPRAAEYCGTSIESLLGHGYVAYMHPADVAHKLRLWNLARETGRPFEAEYRLRGVDGTYRWQLTRALPERDYDGRITRWYGSVVDVDDRRRAEEALREVDRRKDEFLAMLAHELRNPLAPIRHALAIQAKSGDAVSVSREMRQTMERQVTYLVRLVDDLLDVSRLTTGHIELKREPVDVLEIVADAIETCREMLDEKGHHVTTQLPAQPVVVDGDRIRLVQVLTNILNNAAKFTAPGGEIDIVVGCENGAVGIRVRDNGIGISADRLPRIFDLFSQSDPAPDRAHSGLGVGLTLARRLIELHQGTVTASSAGVEGGSEFCILLPPATADRVAGRVVAPAAPVSAGTSARMRVLVVDDYVDATRALERLLTVMGHEVIVAHDGRSGIELAERVCPDVILLDIGLPEMDGYSVARHLRSLPSVSATRIIALTGYGAERARQNFRDAGFDLHLVKPVDADELEAALVGK